MADKCKLYEMYGEACFNQKIFTTGQHMDFSLRVKVKKTIDGVETHRLSGKEKFMAHRSLKRVLLSSWI